MAAGRNLPAGHNLPNLGLRQHNPAYLCETKYKYMCKHKLGLIPLYFTSKFKILTEREEELGTNPYYLYILVLR